MYVVRVFQFGVACTLYIYPKYLAYIKPDTIGCCVYSSVYDCMCNPTVSLLINRFLAYLILYISLMQFIDIFEQAKKPDCTQISTVCQGKHSLQLYVFVSHCNNTSFVLQIPLRTIIIIIQYHAGRLEQSCISINRGPRSNGMVHSVISYDTAK